MSYKKNSSIIVEEVVNNLRRLFQAVNKHSKGTSSETGLTGPQLWAIKVLADEPENSATVSHLAKLMCVNPSTVVRNLDALETRELVQRTRSMGDRRIVNVTLTDKGRAIIRQSPDVAHSVLINGLQSLSENKQITIATGLSQLVSILEAYSLKQSKI